VSVMLNEFKANEVVHMEHIILKII
jgi:hypothetical protein